MFPSVGVVPFSLLKCELSILRCPSPGAPRAHTVYHLTDANPPIIAHGKTLLLAYWPKHIIREDRKRRCPFNVHL